jgi:hypothetical protein
MEHAVIKLVSRMQNNRGEPMTHAEGIHVTHHVALDMRVLVLLSY